MEPHTEFTEHTESIRVVYLTKRAQRILVVLRIISTYKAQINIGAGWTLCALCEAQVPRSLPGVGNDRGRLDIHTKFLGAGEDCQCELVFQVFRTIAEIRLGSVHMCGVGHRILAAFGKPEYAVRKRFFFFIAKTVVHNIIILWPRQAILPA